MRANKTIKIGIISEYRYEVEQAENLKAQGCVINYLQLPQYYESYAKEIATINNQLIYKSRAIIFRLETLFTGTKDAIEKALYFNTPIKIIYDNKEYKLRTLSEWKESTGYGSNATTYKHPVLIAFEEQRKAYNQLQKDITLSETYVKATEGIKEPEEEVNKLVETFRYIYDIQVDFNDKSSVYLAYKSIKFYLDNNIEYSNAPNSTSDTWEYQIDIEDFGDSTYLDDALYKNGVYADIYGNTIVNR